MRTLMAIALLASVLTCALTQIARAEPVPLWTVNFDSAGPVPQRAASRPELASARVGSGLILSVPLGGISRFASIAKIDVNGAPVWLGQHSSSAYFYGSVAKTRVLSDGSVIVISDAIYRYASSGELLWAAAIPSSVDSEIVEVGNRLFLASSNSGQPAALIDRASGRTLETLSYADVGFSLHVSLTTDGADTVYSFTEQGRLINKIRLNPLRVEWSVSLEGTTSPLEASLCCGSGRIVADESGAYVSYGSVVAKVSPADGALLWSQSLAPDYSFSLEVDLSSPADILAFGPNIITSIARTSGVRLWTHVPPAVISAFTVFDDSVAVVGNADPNAPTSSAGFLERIHRDSGVVGWQQSITGSPTTTSSVSGVAVDGDRIAASGVQCETGQRPELCELVLWHTSVGGGAVAMTKPVFPQSVEYFGSAGDAVSTVAAAVVATTTGQQILVRRIRNSDGVILWETSIPASLPNASGQAISEFYIRLTRSAGSDVIIAFGRRPQLFTTIPSPGDIVVAKLDGSNGTLQWRRSLLDTSGGYTDTTAYTFNVQTDTAGNVFASVHDVDGRVPTSPDPIPNRRELRKYSAATGEELLRIAFAPTQGYYPQFQLLPVNFQIVGDVVLTQEAPLPLATFGSFAIDGTTAAVLCNNFPLDISQSILIEGSNAFAAGGISTSPPEIRLARAHAPDCSLAWQSTYSHPSDATYFGTAMSRGSDNGLYVAGRSKIFNNGSNSQWQSVPLMLRADDASGSITWVNRFENDPVLRYSLPRPLFGKNGVLFTLQASYRSLSSYGSFLTGLSEVAGTFLGTSALAFDNRSWPQLPMTTFGIQGLAADGGMIVRRSGDLPGDPTGFSVRKLPLPQPFSGGSLRVSLDTSASVSGAQRTSSFRFDVVNDGTVNGDTVEAILGLPTQSIIDSVSCTIGGSPCVAEATASYVRNVANIGIGEHLVLTGTIRSNAFAISGGSIEASAFSTTGLVEMDMKDNVASINLADVLFSNGFDQ